MKTWSQWKRSTLRKLIHEILTVIYMSEIKPEDFGLDAWPVNRFDAVAKKNMVISEIVLRAGYIPKEYASFIIINITATIKRMEGTIEIVFQRMASGIEFTDNNPLGIVTFPLDNFIRLRKHDELIITISMGTWVARTIPLPVIAIGLRGKTIEINK